MKERPILFNGPMVLALLDGSKTQTRRAVKPQPQMVTGRTIQTWDGPASALQYQLERLGKGCPYGQAGDRLWVRETWYCDDYRVQRGPYLKPADMSVAEAQEDGTLAYRASSGDRPYEAEQPLWRPAIHMPRWASRITLEVTGVRVERLQDISEADAIAEGVKNSLHLPGGRFARENFAHLWWTINGDGSWEANPWVWVVDFKRMEGGAP